MNVDVARLADDGRPDSRAAHERRESRAAAHAHDELRGVHASGEIDQRSGYFLADELMESATEGFGELALRRQYVGPGAREPVGAAHMHREQLSTAGARRNARSAADQGLTLRIAGECHDDTLAGVPALVDALGCPVLLQGDVDLVREPQQGEFAQRGEVSESEIVRERRVHPGRRVDETLGQTIA